MKKNKEKNILSNELLKGSLKTIILKLLKEEGPMYGYQLTGKVEELSQGKIKLTFGALYPILHKLKKEGALVTARELINNRVRVYYALTPKGHSLVKEKLSELTEFVESMRRIVEPKPGISYA